MRRPARAVQRPAIWLLSLCLLGIAPGSARAQAGGELGFDQWLAWRVFAVDVGSRSTSNQTELPALGTNSTTLVDTSSASDLVGMGLQLADLSGSTASSSQSDVTSAAATVSGYALYAAASGIDPLDPVLYCQDASRYARWISGSLGFDDDDGTGGRTILAGAKLEIPFLSRRDPCSPAEFDDLSPVVAKAALAFANLSSGVREALRQLAIAQQDAETDPANKAFLSSLDPSDRGHFNNSLSAENFAKLLTILDDAAVAEAVSAKLDRTAFDAYTKSIEKAIAEFEMQPKLSIAFATNQRSSSSDDYQLRGILDLGLRPGLKLVLNGGWDQRHPIGLSKSNGGSLAIAFELDTNPGRLAGRRGLRIALSSDAMWLSDMPDRYQGQLKVTVPVLEGLELPLTLTFADRTATDSSSEVRGGVAFSVDTAMLTKLLRSAY